MAAYYWMNWLIHTQGMDIRHKLNSGKEVRISKYPVDGYVPASKPGEKPIVLQFHGCFWHGHLCSIMNGVRDEKWQASRAQKHRKTLQTIAFLKRDHQVMEMWECQFRQYCRQNPAIYDFIDTNHPGFFQKHKGKISEDTILAGVVNEELFGMIEVNIEVPKRWPSYFNHSTLAPYPTLLSRDVASILHHRDPIPCHRSSHAAAHRDLQFTKSLQVPPEDDQELIDMLASNFKD